MEIVFHSHPATVICGIEQWYPQILVFFGSDIVKTLLLGLTANGLYDGIKCLLKLVICDIKGKKIDRIQGKSIQKVNPNFQIVINNARFEIPINISDKKFEYFVKELFEYLPTTRTDEKRLYKFDDQSDTFTSETEEELVISKQKRKMKRS